MYLSKLEIIGFKSFAQRVNLAFDSGISAIVGPNGCGKTNIVDAIRWVLGEQRYSALRSEKMEDVIFNGTGNPFLRVNRGRQPLGVLLTHMDNPVYKGPDSKFISHASRMNAEFPFTSPSILL